MLIYTENFLWVPVQIMFLNQLINLSRSLLHRGFAAEYARECTQMRSPTQLQLTDSSHFANHQRLTVNLGFGVVGAASTPI